MIKQIFLNFFLYFIVEYCFRKIGRIDSYIYTFKNKIFNDSISLINYVTLVAINNVVLQGNAIWIRVWRKFCFLEETNVIFIFKSMKRSICQWKYGNKQYAQKRNTHPDNQVWTTDDKTKHSFEGILEKNIFYDKGWNEEISDIATIIRSKHWLK